MTTFAERVKTAREAADYSQEALAIATGLSRRTIQNVEGGHPASAETVRALRAVLDIEAAVPVSVFEDILPPSPQEEWKSFERKIAIGFVGLLVCLPLLMAFAVLGEKHELAWALTARNVSIVALFAFAFLIGVAVVGGRHLRSDYQVDMDRVLARERSLRQNAVG